jgi:hypothetical protein
MPHLGQLKIIFAAEEKRQIEPGKASRRRLPIGQIKNPHFWGLLKRGKGGGVGQWRQSKVMFRIAEHAKMGSIKSGMSKSLKFVASSVAQKTCTSQTKLSCALCGKFQGW